MFGLNKSRQVQQHREPGRALGDRHVGGAGAAVEHAVQPAPCVGLVAGAGVEQLELLADHPCPRSHQVSTVTARRASSGTRRAREGVEPVEAGANLVGPQRRCRRFRGRGGVAAGIGDQRPLDRRERVQQLAEQLLGRRLQRLFATDDPTGEIQAAWAALLVGREKAKQIVPAAREEAERTLAAARAEVEQTLIWARRVRGPADRRPRRGRALPKTERQTRQRLALTWAVVALTIVTAVLAFI